MIFIASSNVGELTSPVVSPAIPFVEQDPLRHLLIGSPRAIRHTIHTLHNLHYVEAGLWSPLLTIPNQQVVITPNPGEMMSVLKCLPLNAPQHIANSILTRGSTGGSAPCAPYLV